MCYVRVSEFRTGYLDWGLAYDLCHKRLVNTYDFQLRMYLFLAEAINSNLTIKLFDFLAESNLLTLLTTKFHAINFFQLSAKRFQISLIKYCEYPDPCSSIPGISKNCKNNWISSIDIPKPG